MANLESILNELDEVLESAVTLPLTNKCMVDADRIRELIDDIRLNMPSEIKQARAVVADRNEILSMAKQEAEELIRKTEERAKALVDNDTIVRQANAKGMAMLSEASLSFLGLGALGQKSWGAILNNAFFRNGVVNSYWWWYYPPILCICLCVVAFLLIGSWDDRRDQGQSLLSM